MKQNLINKLGLVTLFLESISKDTISNKISWKIIINEGLCFLVELAFATEEWCNQPHSASTWLPESKGGRLQNVHRHFIQNARNINESRQEELISKNAVVDGGVFLITEMRSPIASGIAACIFWIEMKKVTCFWLGPPVCMDSGAGERRSSRLVAVALCVRGLGSGLGNPGGAPPLLWPGCYITHMRWFASDVTVTEILLTEPRFDVNYSPEQASHAKTFGASRARVCRSTENKSRGTAVNILVS